MSPTTPVIHVAPQSATGFGVMRIFWCATMSNHWQSQGEPGFDVVAPDDVEPTLNPE